MPLLLLSVLLLLLVSNSWDKEEVQVNFKLYNNKPTEKGCAKICESCVDVESGKQKKLKIKERNLKLKKLKNE